MLETGKSYARYFLDVFRHLRHPLFENRFVNQLRGDKRRDLVPRDFFRGLPDDYYYWLMTFSHNLGQQAGGLIPEIPPAHIQRTWTGSAGQTTFQQAFVFYQRILKWIERYSEKPTEKLEVLDFGSGWGRIIRFFLRDVPHSQLHGTDCWQEIVESSRSLNRWCSFDINSTLPPMQYADQSFDLVYLYSVFSHLSEAAHLAWLGEFRRLLRPGGLLVTTTRPRRFLQILSASRDAHSSKGMYYSATAGEAFPDIQGTLQRYDRGEFCFSPTGGGGPLTSDFYGEACIPVRYVREKWAGIELLAVSRPDRLIDQTVFCCRKIPPHQNAV